MIRPLYKKTNNQKERARRVLIGTLYKGQLKVQNGISMGLCPFHDDHHPSMAVYPETNTFYCFACQESGDSIKFYMKINDVDFPTAIKEMTR